MVAAATEAAAARGAAVAELERLDAKKLYALYAGNGAATVSKAAFMALSKREMARMAL